MMDYEQRILELEKRIQFLEKMENKRITKRKIKIIFEVGKLLLLVTLIVGGYMYIYNNYIKPYKENIDYFNEKIENVENFIDEKWDLINKYNPFS